MYPVDQKMNEKLKKLEAKKILQEYNFLLLDNEYKNELVNEVKTKFLNDISELKKKLGIKDKPVEPTPQDTTQESKKEKIGSETLSEKTKSKLKKIFREIVKLTHPDKINSENLIEIYHKSVEAFETNDVIYLYKVCSELDIEFEIESDEINIFSLLISNQKDEIKKIESSFIWLWINSETDEEKSKIIQMFVDQNFKV